MSAQQMTYYFYEFMVKTERLTENADNSGAGTMNNYYVKTLMLWVCELKPRNWWTENLKRHVFHRNTMYYW